MENMQNYNIEDNNIQQSPQKKEKLKWWIPLLFFLGGILMVVCSLVTEIICRSQEDFILDYQLRRLAAVCWFLVIPSLIYIIVKYNKKSTEEKNQENNQIYSLINNATTLDEKLLIAYIGNNYQKIILQKFSIPALLSWLYTLYRKIICFVIEYVAKEYLICGRKITINYFYKFYSHRALILFLIL